MQRIATLLAVCAPGAVAAQGAAATQLWRLAGTTLTVPSALSTGGTGAIWNPAQRPPAGRASLSLEIVQTPSALSATGLLVVGRLRLHPLGDLGLLYGNMEMADLIRTGTSTMEESGPIPYYAQFVGGNWTMTLGGTTLGATLGLQDVKLDDVHAHELGGDVGISQELPAAFRVAGAAHLFAPLVPGDPHQDFSGGVERRMWRGSLWDGSGPASLTARYGFSLGRGASADHQLGLGLKIGAQFLLDVRMAREGGYGAPLWRGSAGIRVTVGHYGVTYARDAGASEIGSAYRVGLDAGTQ
jgi:hypothetical protein